MPKKPQNPAFAGIRRMAKEKTEISALIEAEHERERQREHQQTPPESAPTDPFQRIIAKYRKIGV